VTGREIRWPRLARRHQQEREEREREFLSRFPLLPVSVWTRFVDPNPIAVAVVDSINCCRYFSEEEVRPFD